MYKVKQEDSIYTVLTNHGGWGGGTEHLNPLISGLKSCKLQEGSNGPIHACLVLQLLILSTIPFY